MKHSPQLKADVLPFETYIVLQECGEAQWFPSAIASNSESECLDYLRGVCLRGGTPTVLHITVEGEASDVSHRLAERWWKELEPEFIGDGYWSGCSDAPQFIQDRLPDLQTRIDDALQELDESKSHAADLAWPR